MNSGLALKATTVLLCLASIVLPPARAADRAEHPAIAPASSEPSDQPSTPYIKSTPEAEEPVRFRTLPVDLLRDQGFLWSRPFRPTRSDLPWAGAFFGTTAGLMVLDDNVGRSLAANPPGTGQRVSERIGYLGTPISGAAIAGTIYLVGRAKHSRHAQATGILGIRAVADSAIIVHTLKAITQRPRPTHHGGVHANHNADGEFFTGGNSFPSGHAAGAFSLATVIAERNRNRPWIPVTAYGLAGLVSVSRVTQRRHFPSDVFVGAVIGHLVGRHVASRARGNDRSARRRIRVEPYVPPAGGSAICLAWEF